MPVKRNKLHISADPNFADLIKLKPSNTPTLCGMREWPEGETFTQRSSKAFYFRVMNRGRLCKTCFNHPTMQALFIWEALKGTEKTNE